jgi:putative tricarboxylic transport membrane protein
MAQQPGGATSAIILLSCIYWGALFGGAITSILFNIPGEPWSVATTFDGYPLAQKGRAARRSPRRSRRPSWARWWRSCSITFMAPLVARFALRFGPPRVLLGLPAHVLRLRGHEQGAPFKTIAR